MLLHGHKQDIDGAETEYREAIKIDPTNADAYNNLGMLLHGNKQDIGGAKEHYIKALRIDPKHHS